MVDINLLEDTPGEGGDDQKKNQKKEPESIEYTKPVHETEEIAPKPKNGLFGGFFRKKTNHKPAINNQVPPTPPKPQPSIKPVIPVPKPPDKSTDSTKDGIFNGWFGRRSQPVPVPPARARNTNVPRPPLAKDPGESAEAKFRNSYAQKEKMKKIASQVLEEKVIQKKPQKAEPINDFSGEDKKSFLDVNLMPGDIMEELEPRKKLIIYGIVTVASIALVAGLYLALNYYEHNILQNVAETSGQIAKVESDIGKLRKEQQDAILFKSRTDQVKEAIDKHIHWSNFFTKLEANTLNEVQYNSFAGSFTRGTNPTFSLNAVGGDFLSISRQIMAFEAPKAADFIVSVSANNGARVLPKTPEEKEYVEFTLQFTVFENVFYDTGNKANSTGTGEEN